MKRLPVLIALVLLGVLIFQWIGWPPSSVSNEAPGESESPAPVASADASDLLARLDTQDNRDNYVSIIEHPLFRPDRKPEPTIDELPSEPTPAESAELSAFDLTAVLITSDIVSAWIRDPSQPKLRRIRIGDDLQGWSVLDIREDRVLVERQGQQDALILRDYSQASPAAAPPPGRKSVPRPPPRAPARPEPPKS